MQSRIVICLLLVVLLIPLCEFFDHGVDLNPDGDFVRALICVFVATSLCLVCRKVISFVPRLFRIDMIPPASMGHGTDRGTEAQLSAPESLLLLSNLRI